ncbi:MAG: bifunctional methylenetetrahydrofolate dehydrogenase/methenyltetrahydrofolate cyclohydrolase FolD [Desulfomonilia bacterium]
MATIIDGNALSKKKRHETALKATIFTEKYGRPPGLAVVLVGKDPASAIYVRNKKTACETAGLRSFDFHLDAATSRDELLALVKNLNADPDVDGILVQFPVPPHLDSQEIQLAIDPKKDVDGLHPYNLGRLLSGTPTLVPCTPSGIMCMLREYGVSLKGKDAVVIGRSNLVGKPIAVLLMMEHATITICHSRTLDLDKKVKAADIVVAAIGKAEMIRGEWIKQGAVVIDVGMNRTEAGLKGDVQFEGASGRASLITPVPGGVGPMTITMLLDNTLRAAMNHVS